MDNAAPPPPIRGRGSQLSNALSSLTNSPSHTSLFRLRTASSTPSSSPSLLSPLSNSPHPTSMSANASPNPNILSNNVRPLPAQPVHSYSEPAVHPPLLHPLQKYKVRETHKALIDSHEVTGRKVINQYEVIEELGRGMHGKVKLARNRNTGDSVAIKIIPRFAKNRRLGKVMVSPQDKTKKEIAILKKIRHDNVVALLEVIDDPELKKIYMVLEHVELGEIVWRKKGLPSICQYERKRVEREMQGGAMTPEEERYYTILDNRAVLNEVRRARQQSQISHSDYMWSLEHGGSAGDSSPSNRSRIPSRDDLGHHETVLSSRSASVGPSRDTSRAPSRTQSIRSMVVDDCVEQGGHLQAQTQLQAQLQTQLQPQPSPLQHQQHSHSLFQPLGFHEDGAFRGRSPSMAESLFSHMSSIDLNTHHEDPFADDYSYVPCFTIEQARSTFRDTVLGLEYLHYQGVVHRDIKPANLLWTRDHHVKISDFGVSYFGRPIRDGESGETVSESEAQDFDDDLELAKTVGTPAFFAPELCYTDPDIAKEAPKVSEQIDVWSLGVTLYCLIFARIPFLAEDEYQMFRKIAEQEVYIPKRRLRPVDPQTAPTSTSLYKSSQPTAGQYRDDSQRMYEDIDPHLHDVLSQMLVKDPEQRIKLRDIKRHPWVLNGIADAARWLDETDPARPSSGRRIQVDEREMTDAVVPLKFLERARSTIKKTVDKLIGPLTDRAESRSRRTRAASSTTSSVAGPEPSSLAPRRDVLHRRPSLRGEEHLSSPSSPSSSVGRTADHGRLTSSSVPPGFEEVGYDPLATVLVHPQQQHPPFNHHQLFHHQQQLQQLPQSHHHPYHAPTHSRTESMAVETGDDEYRPSHSSYSQPQLHSSQYSQHLIPSLGLRRANFANPLNYIFPLRSPRLEPQSVPTTPLDVPDPMHMPLPVTLDRDVDRETSRSRSVDRAMFSAANKHSTATVGLTQVVAHGSSMRVRRPRQMRSVDLSRPGSVGPHSPRTPTEYRLPHPGSDSDVRRPRASEVRSLSLQRALGSDDGRLPYVNSSASSVGSFSPFEESYLRQHMERSPSHLRLQPTIRENCVSPASAPCPASPPPSTYRRHLHRHSHSHSQSSPPRYDVAKTARSTSFADPMMSPSAEHQQQQFQSDPSLPALLSGASSVSTDLEGELLLRPGIVGRTAALLDTSDSLTPPALQKEPVAGFPLEPLNTKVLTLDVPASPVEGRRPTSSPMTITPVVDDDDDSDSDEGFVMMKSKRTRRPTDVGARPADVVGVRAPVYERRNTGASTGSTETAKKVVV